MFNWRKNKKPAAPATPNPHRAPSSSPRPKQSLLSLEQRLMFDAAAAATASEVASEQVAQEQADAAVSSDGSADQTSTEQTESQELLQAIVSYSPGESTTEVAFIDPTVPDYESLIAGMGSNVEIIMLDATRDGMEQIAESLADRSGIDAIHLITHGAEGRLNIGTSALTHESMMGQYVDELATIQQALSEQADILVYGCDFAEGQAGQEAATLLSQLTGADVAASTDATGFAGLGGDWVLEMQIGTVETQVAVDYGVQANWVGLLAGELPPTISNLSGDSLAYSEGAGAVVIEQSGNALVADVDSANFDTGRLTVSIPAGNDSAEDVLTIRNQGTGAGQIGVSGSNVTYGGVTIGTFAGGSSGTNLVVTLNASATPMVVTALVRNITYQDTDTNAPTTGARTVRYVLTDGDGGTSANYDTTVTVSGVNDAPTDLALSASTVAENAATGAVVGTVTGTDVDAGDTKTYSLTNTAGGRFAINTSTGQITVANGSLLNYESAPSHSVTVRVTDRGGLTYDEAFTISLTNVNEAPTDLNLSANTVAENAANGTVVGAVTGTDPDSGDTKTYSLSDTAGGRFAINSSTGVITVANGSLLNYESAPSHSVTVRVTDSGGLTYDEAFAINLTNVNEAPTGADATVTLAEDTSRTLTAANFGFSDVDTGDTLSAVRIDSVPSAGTLTLSGVAVTAGQVVRLADISAGRLVFAPTADANGTGYATVAFSVRDSAGSYDAVPNTLTVSVTPVNDAPVLSTNKGGTVDEGGAIVLTGKHLQVADVDTPPNELRYTLTALPANGALLLKGTPLGLKDSFTQEDINNGILEYVHGSKTTLPANDTILLKEAQLTGKDTVAQASIDSSSLEYAHDGGEAASDSFAFVVSDGAGGNLGESMFKIAVTPVNDAPVLSTNEGGTVDEGGAIVLTGKHLRVTDADTPPNELRYMLTSLPANGALLLKGTPLGLKDSFTQEDINNEILEYVHDGSETTFDSLTFVVEDGTGGTLKESTFEIVVNLVNEAPTDLSLSANTVAENAASGMVVGTITGTDVDTGDTKAYSLTDTAGGRFAINSSTGVITVANGSLLNYESTPSHTVTVRVTDSGGQTYDEAFTINLTNVNEGPTGADATVTLAEDTAHPLTTANFGFSDVDAGDTLSAVRIDTVPSAGSLTLSGVAVTAGQVVTVADITAGRLVFNPTENANGMGYASFTFSVRDAHNTYDASPNTLTVNVTAVNDAPTDLALSANTVAENAATGTVVGTITSADPDAGDTTTYALTDAAGGRFAINSSTGVLTVANGSLLNYEVANSHSVIVRVTDSGGATYDEAFTIDLTNVNEAPTGTDATITINEDTAHTLTTATFGFSDVDAGDSLSAVRIDTIPTAGTLTLSGVEVTDGQVVLVTDITAGNLVFTPTADANGTGYASFTFSVRDGNNVYDAASGMLTFDVIAVNDVPVNTVPGPQSVAEDTPLALSGLSVNDADGNLSSVQLAVANGTVTVTLAGPATISAGSNGSTTLTLSGTQADINATLATLSYQGNVNFTGNDLLTVTSRDSNAVTDVDTVAITVNPVNDAPTDLSLSANTVAENAVNGTVVGTVTGIDIDAGDAKSYSLTGTAGGRFAINSSTGVITVANDSLLNYEAATSHTVTVRVTDSSGTTYDETFTINVTNVNEALTDVSLSANTVVEKSTNGTVVGNVTGTDPDAGDTHTYQLMDTAGGRFAINSSTGVITVADSSLLNYEAAPSHSVTVRVTDAGGLTRDQTFTITLANVNEDPVTFTGGSISLQQKAIQTEDRRLQSEGLRPPNVETVESKNVAYPAYSQDEVMNGIPQDGTRSDVSKEPPSFSPAQIVAVTRFLDVMASSEGPSPIHEMLDRHFEEVKQLLQTAEDEAPSDPVFFRNQPDHLQTVLSAWLIANGVNLVPTWKPLVRARQSEGDKPTSLENEGRQSF